MRSWPAGAVTGIGSLPGTDMDEAMRLVFGELPDLPHLPELPNRGAGAELIGRGAVLLPELPVEIQPSGWRLTARPGRDVRRARDLLDRDLDALQRHAEEYAGALKIQVTGPWTLAANIELPSGHRVISDRGATRDVVQALIEGLGILLNEVSARVPSARLVIQLDEPSVPAVLAGRISTPSGYGTVAAVEAALIEQALREVLAAAPEGGRVVHCCAAEPPLDLFRAAGADALAFDLGLIGKRHYDALGESVDAGVSLWMGVIPSTDAAITLDTGRAPIRAIWAQLGFAPEKLGDTVVPTPTCGLAGATPAYVRRALKVLRDVGRSLVEE